MGKQIATNYVNSIIRININIINTNVTACTFNQKTNNTIKIVGSNNIKLNDITQTGDVAVNSVCYNKAVNVNKVSAQITSDITQKVIQFEARFLPGLSKQESKNFLKMSIGLGLTIANTNETTCALSNISGNDITIDVSQNVTLQGVDQKSVGNAYVNCIAMDTNSNDAAVSLRNFVSQKLAQVNIGPLALFLLIPILIALALAVVLMVILVITGIFKHHTGGSGSGGGRSGGILPVLLSGLWILSAFMLIGYYAKWWPYEQVLLTDTSKDANRRNEVILAIFLIIFVGTTLFLGYSIYKHLKEKKSAKEAGVRGKPIIDKGMVGSKGRGEGGGGKEGGEDKELQEFILIEELKGLKGEKEEKAAKKEVAEAERKGGEEATEAEAVSKRAEDTSVSELRTEEKAFKAGEEGEAGESKGKAEEGEGEGEGKGEGGEGKGKGEEAEGEGAGEAEKGAGEAEGAAEKGAGGIEGAAEKGAGEAESAGEGLLGEVGEFAGDIPLV